MCDPKSTSDSLDVFPCASTQDSRGFLNVEILSYSIKQLCGCTEGQAEILLMSLFIIIAGYSGF